MLEANDKGVDRDGNRDGLPLLRRLDGLWRIVRPQPQAEYGTELRPKTGFGAFRA